ncbi:MAG: AI-2E family transporter [Betaproteobacteria bacterium]|nr:AI-2E family transporter [Betaproteobacteria bacterium]
MTAVRRADLKKWWWLALGLAFLVLLYFLSSILTPFLLAGILAYICNPLVGWLERQGTGRTLASVIAMLLLFGLLAALAVIVLPLFYKEFKLLAERLPGYLEHFNTEVVPWFGRHFGVDIQLDADTMRQYIAESLQGTEGLGMKVLQSLKIGGLTLIGFLVNVLLIPVVLFYLMRDWNGFLAKLDGLIPRRWHAKAREIAAETDAVLAEFLRGQIAVIIVMSAFYSLGLWLTGLEFFLPIGIITGILVFVPYVGALTGLALATLAALMQFGATAGLVWVLVVYAAGQALEGMVVTPWLVGQRIGLHPVAVIFAILAFGQLFGFFGVLLALPASAALLVALRHLHRRYYASALYGSRQD